MKENANYSMNINFVHARELRAKKHIIRNNKTILKSSALTLNFPSTNEWIKQTLPNARCIWWKTLKIVWKILFCLRRNIEWLCEKKYIRVHIFSESSIFSTHFTLERLPSIFSLRLYFFCHTIYVDGSGLFTENPCWNVDCGGFKHFDTK